MPEIAPGVVPTVVVDRSRPGVAVLSLHRPAKRNALDRAMVRGLGDALADGHARAVVIRSADARCFSAGADLDLADAERALLSDELYELYEQIIDLDVPVIAAVDGIAVGGGAQIAAAADLRIGGPAAAFRFAGPGHGLAVGAWALPSLVGRGRAIDLCLSMRPIGAEEALAIGLLDRLADDGGAAAIELAGQLAELDAGAAGRVKRIVRDGCGLRTALLDERGGNASWSGAIGDARSGAHG
jgi:enoyl-CoA hydratase/carnithine racemase